MVALLRGAPAPVFSCSLPCYVRPLNSNRVVFGVGISCPGRDDVTNPPERAASTDPKPGCKDQPKNARQNSPVVELSYARDN